MTLKYFNVKNGLVTGNITLDASSSNVTASTFLGNISVTTSANLGAVGNITITGGTNGYVLQTNGSGGISWVNATSLAGFGNLATLNKDGNASNILYGNGVFAASTSSQSAITVDNFTGNGVQTTFNLSVSPSNVNMITINYNGAMLIRDSYSISGNTLTLGSAPSDGSKLEVTSITSLAGPGIDTNNLATLTYVDNSIANLVASAPTALNTLNELSIALGNDASFSTTITNTLANKLNSNAFTYANITGKPTLGNISTINLDGNASNLLYGNGVFSAAPTSGTSNARNIINTYVFR